MKKPNPNNKMFRWQGLDNNIRVEIIECVYDNSEFLRNNYTLLDFKELCDNSDELPNFMIKYRDVNFLWEKINGNCNITEINLNNLIHHLENDGELSPVLLDGDNFYDGCHRLSAYKELDIKEIPTIDISLLLNIDWEKWLDGDIDFTFN